MKLIIHITVSTEFVLIVYLDSLKTLVFNLSERAQNVH